MTASSAPEPRATSALTAESSSSGRVSPSASAEAAAGSWREPRTSMTRRSRVPPLPSLPRSFSRVAVFAFEPQTRTAFRASARNVGSGSSRGALSARETRARLASSGRSRARDCSAAWARLPGVGDVGEDLVHLIRCGNVQLLAQRPRFFLNRGVGIIDVQEDRFGRDLADSKQRLNRPAAVGRDLELKGDRLGGGLVREPGQYVDQLRGAGGRLFVPPGERDQLGQAVPGRPELQGVQRQGVGFGGEISEKAGQGFGRLDLLPGVVGRVFAKPGGGACAGRWGCSTSTEPGPRQRSSAVLCRTRSRAGLPGGGCPCRRRTRNRGRCFRPWVP